MKGLKEIIIAAIVVMAACCLQADDLLFWFIGEEAPAFDFAKMLVGVQEDGAIVGGQYVNNIFADWQDEMVYDERPDWPPTVQAADLRGLGDTASLSFIVELYNYDGEVSHTSQIYDFSSLPQYMANWDDFNFAWQHIEPLRVFEFNEAIPEPSSGLLTVLGAGLLALRRKRRKGERS